MCKFLGTSLSSFRRTVECVSTVKHSTSHLILLAAVLWRRCSFRVKPGRPSPKEPFLADGSPCDNERTEGAQEPAFRLSLDLLNKRDLSRILVLELSPRERRNLQVGRVRHNALESHSFWRQLQQRRERHPRSARRALPHLLAADFCFRLPARLLSRRRRGSHTGFLCHDSGT